MIIGIFVSIKNSVKGTLGGKMVRPETFIVSIDSPSGNTKSPPGSMATIAFTWLFLMAVRQPGPPLWEWVTKMPCPNFLNREEKASIFTCAS
jgi:hypothetical protein